ncbi:uncharacterized protein LOC135598980 isoform X2 [Musa acuminata AAA Group]|uniref:uncharacterized protein LOC135598980 isoform X2 n=1 Tax=Musa acuminata AAA Group TaxID=214697 RepID=UPI0031D0148B
MGKRENKAGELGDESEGGDEKTFEEGVWDTHPRLRRRQVTEYILPPAASLSAHRRREGNKGLGSIDRPRRPRWLIAAAATTPKRISPASSKRGHYVGSGAGLGLEALMGQNKAGSEIGGFGFNLWIAEGG